MMDRRALLGGLALGTLAVPRVARAQPARKVYRIGILGSTSTTSDMVGPLLLLRRDSCLCSLEADFAVSTVTERFSY